MSSMRYWTYIQLYFLVACDIKESCILVVGNKHKNHLVIMRVWVLGLIQDRTLIDFGGCKRNKVFT